MPSRKMKIKSQRCVMRTLKKNGYKVLSSKDEFNFRVVPPGGKRAFDVLAYGRCILWAKNLGNLRIAFCDAPESDNCNVYMYPHDKLLTPFLKRKVGKIAHPKDWKGGLRSWAALTVKLREQLEPYRIPRPTKSARIVA